MIKRLLIGLVFIVIIQGCQDQSFDALGCEWKRPDGYTDTPRRLGYSLIVPDRSIPPKSIRYYPHQEKPVGQFIGLLPHQVLNVSHYEVPENARYLAGLKTLSIEREGFKGRVIIVEERLELFLIGCEV